MSSEVCELLRGRRLIVLVGEGGVGKTTCAAALGLALASEGLRTAVLTIDPAPRLGHALGLERIDEHPRAIEIAQPNVEGGSLDAFRLDTKGTFDRIVEQLAPGEDGARPILDHPIYRAVSGSIGGSDAYMALQRIYELERDGRYDVVVLDTPPAVHARDLLTAPARLAALIETDAVKVLADPAFALARAGSRFAKASVRVLLPLLERLTGLELRRDVAEFIERFESVLVELSERARVVETLLRSPDTAFLAAARPSDAAVDAVISLIHSFAERNVEIAGVVVNRVTPASAKRPRRAKALEGAPEGTAAAIERMEAAMASKRVAEHEAMQRLRRELAHAATPLQILEIASLEHDVRDVAELASLARTFRDWQAAGAS